MLRITAITTSALLMSCCHAATGPDDILRELNEMRSNPAGYAGKLESRRKYYSGRMLRMPKQVPIQTAEGVAALNEAVRALRSEKPLPPFSASRALNSAAADHVQDIGPKGLVAHQGTTGSSPSDRVRRHGSGFSEVAEVISFGPEDPASVVIDLLVDDGVRNRGHRKILFEPSLRLAGIACGKHAVYRTMCVIDFADRLNEK